MCFSAAASFIAGGGLVAAGVATIHQAKKYKATRKSHLPLAFIPLLFGVHQLVEGVVWVSSSIPWLQATAAFIYVMFSHVLWPTFVPLAVMMLEKPGRRRKALKGLLLFGMAISAWLFVYLVQGPVLVTLTARGCVYDMTTPPIPYGLAAYVFVTCFSFFISSHKFVRLLGIAMVGALSISLVFYHQVFYSVWCFFAAILSILIYVHLTDTRAEVRRLIKRAEKAVKKMENILDKSTAKEKALNKIEKTVKKMEKSVLRMNKAVADHIPDETKAEAKKLMRKVEKIMAKAEKVILEKLNGK